MLSLLPKMLGVCRKQYTMVFSGLYTESIRSTSTVGFIGLGNMGTNMAQNLLNKGETLIVYDVQSEPLKEFSSKSNVIVAKTIKELAKESSYIITMLPNSEIVWSVYTSDDGIFKNCRQSDAVFIDSSTIDPTIVQKLKRTASETNRLFLDAPVSGGVMGAEAGTLTFMVGGCDTKIPENVSSLLMKMGVRVVQCGSSGMGQVAKLCNNMLLGATMVAVAETFNLGVKSGLDPKILTSVVNNSSGRCWASEVNNPIPGILKNAPSTYDYKGGFKTNLLVKDMNLGLEMAGHTNTYLELIEKALELYKEAIRSKNIGDLDFSVIYKSIAEQSE